MALLDAILDKDDVGIISLLTILDIIFDIIQRKYSLDDFIGYLRQWVKDRVRLDTALAEKWTLLNFH